MMNATPSKDSRKGLRLKAKPSLPGVPREKQRRLHVQGEPEQEELMRISARVESLTAPSNQSDTSPILVSNLLLTRTAMQGRPSSSKAS